jgi:hypothetical protein
MLIRATEINKETELWITEFLGVVHRLLLYRKLRKLDLFPSTGERVGRT